MEVTTARTLVSVVPAVETLEGEGFVVRRPFPRPGVDQIDPFLLLDELGPRDMAPGEAKGAPDHPHRGFETVTYLLEGEFEHRDSVGSHGVLRPGDVQWMTAGAGVVHSEMPSERLQREGGRLHGFQLWVNLPAATKMQPPRYQEIPSAQIPVVEQDGVTVRIITGDYAGVRGTVETQTPITYLHVKAPGDRALVLPAPIDRNAMIYVVEGGFALEDGRAAERGDLAVFHRDGEQIELRTAADGPTELLVLTGTPLNEPLARYGPFVMNDRSQIIEAIEDFQAGRMGAIA